MQSCSNELSLQKLQSRLKEGNTETYFKDFEAKNVLKSSVKEGQRHDIIYPYQDANDLSVSRTSLHGYINAGDNPFEKIVVYSLRKCISSGCRLCWIKGNIINGAPSTAF